MKKKVLLLLLICVLGICLAACGGNNDAPADNGGATDDSGDAAAPAEQKVIKISLSVTPEHECYQRFVEFGEKVNAQCNNAFKFELYPSDQLGDYSLVTEELIRGNVEMLVGSVSTGVDSRFDLTFTPYLANSLEDAKTVFAADGFVSTTVGGLLSDLGITMLGFDVIGMGGLSMGPKCPANPYEIGSGNSALIRSPGNEHVRKFLTEMGYNPTTVNWSEVYTSMQTGVVDGFLGATASTAYLQFRDVIKYYVPIDIWTEVQYIAFSSKVWDTLTPEQQEVFRSVSQEMFLTSIDQTIASDSDYYAQLEAAGVQVIYPAEGDIEALAQMAREKAWPAAEERLGTELYHQLLDQYGIAY